MEPQICILEGQRCHEKENCARTPNSYTTGGHNMITKYPKLNRVNPLVYLKLWKQALLFGAELCTLTLAEAIATSVLASQTYFLCFRVCTWSFATEAFRSEFN